MQLSDAIYEKRDTTALLQDEKIIADKPTPKRNSSKRRVAVQQARLLLTHL